MSKKAILHGKKINLPQEYKTLTAMLLHIAKQFPQHGMTFVDIAGKEEFISYLELTSNAKRCLAGLRQQGLRPGDVLIVAIDNPRDFYEVFWASIFGGIVVAPIHQPSFDEGSSTLQKLLNVWQVLKKPALIIEDKYKEYYQDLCAKEHFNDLHFFSYKELSSNRSEKHYNADEDEIAILQFSSGSTGIPKGVQLTHTNIICNMTAVKDAYQLSPDDNVFSWLPHSHDMGLFLQYLSSVVTGSNIFIFSPMTFVRSPFLFLKKLSEHRGTWFGSPNFGIDWMTKNIPDNKLSELDLSSLKYIVNGAEPISVNAINSFVAKFSACGYKAEMMRIAYGMAEVTVCAAVTELNEAPRIVTVNRHKLINENVAVDGKEEDQIKFVHVGKPIGAISIRVADQDGHTLDENRIGEIQVQGPSITSGYFNLEAINKEMFVDDWLRTGDLGFMREGSLVMTGRMKDIIFVRGQNYFAHDLEHTLLQYEPIQPGNLLVVGLTNDRTQAEELLIFVKHKGAIEKFLPLRQRLISIIQSAFGMDVTHVIPVKSIPKTTSGKLQRFQLRQEYQNGVFNQTLEKIDKLLNPQLENIKDLREINLEANIKKIWSKVLGIDAQKIALDSDFYTLGGNSVKAFQFLGELSELLEQEIDSDILVKCKSINHILDYLSSTDKAASTLDITMTSNDKETFDDRSVAITGMAFRLPAARTQEELWDNLVSGKDLIAEVSAKRKSLAKENEWNEFLAELEDVEYFDNDFFDISAEEAVLMDPQQRLILEISYEALEDAGLLPGAEEERNIGVFTGVSINTYYQLLIDHLQSHGIDNIHPHALVGNLNNMISALVSRTYNFTGPSVAVDTACSSFLIALDHAVQGLRRNSIEGAVVAGANILSTSAVHKLSRKAGILSKSKYAKVFDKDADGSVLGEGVLVFCLEKLSDAVKKGKQIYGVIRGTAINNDGRSFGVMAPNPNGQYRVLASAYKDANMSPDEVSYIEVHGTGTTIGDPIEVNSLSKIFSQYSNKRDIDIGSVKANLGHLLPAAGAAGLAKVLLCFKHQKIVPSLHLNIINPSLKLDKSPFNVVTTVKEWQPSKQRSRKAGLSSFGLGGTNAHIVLEEWNKPQVVNTFEQPLNLLTLSAKSEYSLNKMIDDYIEFVVRERIDINNLCFTRNRYRFHHAYRAGLLLTRDGLVVNAFRAQKNHAKCFNPKISVRINDIRVDGCRCSNEDLFSYWYGLLRQLKEYAPLHNIYGLGSGKWLADSLLGCCDYSEAEQNFASGVKGPDLVVNDGARIILSLGDDAGSCEDHQVLINIASASTPGVSSVLSSPLSSALSSPVSSALSSRRRRGLTRLGSLTNVRDDRGDPLRDNRGDPLRDDRKEPHGDGRRESDSREQLLSIIAELYVAGGNINWTKLHPDDSGQIMNLPPYPFASKPFWITTEKSSEELSTFVAEN